MIARLLCWLGLHDWHCIEAWSGVYSDRETVTQTDKWACLSCGKQKRFYAHPEAEAIAARNRRSDDADASSRPTGRDGWGIRPPAGAPHRRMR